MEVARKDTLLRGMRWAEPVGQFLVLSAIGFQLFFLTDARSHYERVHNSDGSEGIHRFNSVLIKQKLGISLTKSDKMLIDNKDWIEDDSKEKIDKDWKRLMEAKQTLENYAMTYTFMFVIGSVLTIAGKSSSIMLSKK